jgi:uncharacterized protein
MEFDDFEWDEAKNALNFKRHGMSFEISAIIFDGRARLDELSRNSNTFETRYFTIAEFDDIVLVCVWTYRGQKRRIISLRTASKRERHAYSKAIR